MSDSTSPSATVETTSQELTFEVESPETVPTVRDPLLSTLVGRLVFEGMSSKEKVWRLHVQGGLTLSEVSRELQISYQAVWKTWKAIEAELAAMPSDPAIDLQSRRGMVRARLEGAFAKACRIADSERSLVLQLKTLELMAKLDGLNIEPQSGGPPLTPYALPEEIAGSVRQKLLELHGRGTTTKPA
jgi:hypothetical protein